MAQPTHVRGWLIQILFLVFLAIGLKFRDGIQNSAPLCHYCHHIERKNSNYVRQLQLQIFQISAVEILWLNHPPLPLGIRQSKDRLRPNFFLPTS